MTAWDNSARSNFRDCQYHGTYRFPQVPAKHLRDLARVLDDHPQWTERGGCGQRLRRIWEISPTRPRTMAVVATTAAITGSTARFSVPVICVTEVCNAIPPTMMHATETTLLDGTMLRPCVFRMVIPSPVIGLLGAGSFYRDRAHRPGRCARLPPACRRPTT